MQVISNWLKGTRNFTVGRLLYDTYGKDKGLKALFASSGKTPYTQKRLESELEAILAAGRPPAAPTSIVPPKAQPEEKEPVLVAIENEWRPVYKRLTYLEHQLAGFGSDNSRETRIKCHALAEEILATEQQVMAMWARRDYYLEHGRLPEAINPEEDKIPTDPVKLALFIENCKRYIRRNRQNALRNPDKPIYAQLVKDWTRKLNKATGNDAETQV